MNSNTAASPAIPLPPVTDENDALAALLAICDRRAAAHQKGVAKYLGWMTLVTMAGPTWFKLFGPTTVAMLLLLVASPLGLLGMVAGGAWELVRGYKLRVFRRIIGARRDQVRQIGDWENMAFGSALVVITLDGKSGWALVDDYTNGLRALETLCPKAEWRVERPTRVY